MVNAFKQIRLTNSLVTVTGGADTRLQIGSRQVVYTDETGAFGGAGTKVSSLNTLTGALTASGYGNITVTNDGTNVVRISGDVSNLATVSNLASTGSNLQSQITTDIANLATTGSTLQTQITSLNNWTGREISFVTGINPTGFDSYQVNFPFIFSSTPRVVASLEITGEILYSLAIKSRNVTGYTVLFSDLIAESGVTLHTLATLN